MLDERPSSLAIWNVVGTSKRMLGTSLPTVERRMHPLPNVQHLQRSMGPADLLDFLQSATSSIGPNFASEGANLNARCYCDGRFSIRKLDDFHFLSQTRVNVPRPSASLRSCLSLVHRSVDGLIKTEAIRCASVRPMPRVYNLRALSRSMRALRASRTNAVFSATPVNSWAMRTRSSSSARVVLIGTPGTNLIALNDVILCACICRVTNATDLDSVAAGRKNSF